MRVSMQAVSMLSRATGRAGREVRDKDRVVGMCRACIAVHVLFESNYMNRTLKRRYLPSRGIHG